SASSCPADPSVPHSSGELGLPMPNRPHGELRPNERTEVVPVARPKPNSPADTAVVFSSALLSVGRSLHAPLLHSSALVVPSWPWLFEPQAATSAPSSNARAK